MGLTSETAQSWGVTDTERQTTYPCDAHAHEPYRRYLRAVDVNADAVLTFRWVCQLKVAPYSYDWIDQLGRRSPRTLTPGAAGRPERLGRRERPTTGHRLSGKRRPSAPLNGGRCVSGL